MLLAICRGETDYLPKWIGKTLLKRESGGIRNYLDRWMGVCWTNKVDPRGKNKKEKYTNKMVWKSIARDSNIKVWISGKCPTVGERDR